ncbi:serine hydrolase domain-containing protein [Stakelama saccharophila]|uniref:Serine hydrolase domain-containing protein n=1 Tax=Stakelama saccharophila TaxID=3075605 RepID=A0ABZ0B5M6_9SPHN|nr:serine hydrolase domain-containing protein [Stakelama sp. W311]WNO52578.1 serine hydrolase domain-containing protein [Stakelama sp. W311]
MSRKLRVFAPRRAVRIGLASLLVAAPLPALAQALTAEQTQAVDKIVTGALSESQVPSASIAIVRDGRIVYTKAYGDQGPNVAGTTADARYQIASISKQFTAAGLLLLEDQGKLDLDDKVAKYFPEITGSDKMTIRNLLSHTSGLQDYWPQDYSFALMEDPVKPQEIVDRWAKKPLDFEPGTQWQYSNTGYVVAGMILEKVSGEKLMPFLRKHIFRPLHMNPINQDLAQGKGFPTGYHRYALGPVRPEKPAAPGWLWAAGELSMTAGDLARWDIARIDRTVLPDDDWKAQETVFRLADGTPTGYGLGVSLSERDGDKVVSHGGEAVGFLSENVVVPAEKFAVVALVNADFGRATSAITKQISDLLLPAAHDRQVEQARLMLARKFFKQLQSGKPDRSLLTADARYYFSDQAVQDYAGSLAPLGEPTSFEAIGEPRLRGGFVNRNYRITYPDRTLLLVTYAQAGTDGKFEQFIVMPGG